MNLTEYKEKISASVAKISEIIGTLPSIGIITGTGLGDLIGDIEIAGSVDYSELLFPASTVDSHKGVLSWGTLSGKPVFILQGRFHLYEGYTPWEIALPIRALSLSGMKTLILTNAAGGLDISFKAGEVMVIEDHINATGENPLVGAHCDEWGDRFPDMSKAWDRSLQEIALSYAKENGAILHNGVYVAVKGPSLETPAETRMYKNCGARAIGMSTVLEAIVAVQCKVKVFGLSAITNVNNPDDMAEATLDEIVKAAENASTQMRQIIKAVCSEITT